MLRIHRVCDASWHSAIMFLTSEYADIGESFRPVAHPYLIRSAYGISWLYIAGDVANEGYKAYMRNQRLVNPETAEEPVHGNIVDKAKSLKSSITNTAGVKAGASSGNGSSLTGGEIVPGSVPAIEDWRAVAAQRAVFQSVASMGLPALTIHSIVRYSGRAMKNVKNVRLRTWGPIGVSSIFL
jgi:fission process protein 1